MLYVDGGRTVQERVELNPGAVQLVRARGAGVALGPLKTQASYRTLPLATVVIQAIAAHLTEWPATREPGLIFTNERGAPIQQHPFAVVWATARRGPSSRHG